MTTHLKRTVFFFCILLFGLGCCLGKAVAQDNQTYISIILKEHSPREISGTVFCNGIGLEGVGIYGKDIPELIDIPLEITDSQGYYKINGISGVGDTLTPKKDSYQFDPPFRVIPVNQHNQVSDKNLLFDGRSIKREKVGVKEKISSKKGKEDLLKNKTWGIEGKMNYRIEPKWGRKGITPQILKNFSFSALMST